jgi:hypothetical protein
VFIFVLSCMHYNAAKLTHSETVFERITPDAAAGMEKLMSKVVDTTIGFK